MQQGQLRLALASLIIILAMTVSARADDSDSMVDEHHAVLDSEIGEDDAGFLEGRNGLSFLTDDDDGGLELMEPAKKRDLLYLYPEPQRFGEVSKKDVLRGGRQRGPNEYVKRHLCIPPTRSCNIQPFLCCPNTTCRCNLWGQNCRCLRMGFFQRWGKKK